MSTWADIRDHETQPLTEPLVRHADVIYTMTRCHRDALVAQWPGAAERTKLPAPTNRICVTRSGDPRSATRCAVQIRAELEIRLDELEL